MSTWLQVVCTVEKKYRTDGVVLYYVEKFKDTDGE